MDYAEYLQTPRWKRLTNAVYYAQNKCCRICGKRYNLEVHHLDYAHIGTEREFKDLVLLCHTHHSLCHWWFLGFHKVPLKKKNLVRRYRFVRAAVWGRFRPSQLLRVLFGWLEQTDYGYRR